MKTAFTAVVLVVLSLAGPALAQVPDWSQLGDYYQPNKTIVQNSRRLGNRDGSKRVTITRQLRLSWSRRTLVSNSSPKRVTITHRATGSNA